MKDTKRLKAIRAWCINALENIASKRTPGEREYAHKGDVTWDVDGASIIVDYNDETNAFVASCAEAGWKTTIAAIDSCITDDSKYQPLYSLANADMIAGILSAWKDINLEGGAK